MRNERHCWREPVSPRLSNELGIAVFPLRIVVRQPLKLSKLEGRLTEGCHHLPYVLLQAGSMLLSSRGQRDLPELCARSESRHGESRLDSEFLTSLAHLGRVEATAILPRACHARALPRRRPPQMLPPAPYQSALPSWVRIQLISPRVMAGGQRLPGL